MPRITLSRLKAFNASMKAARERMTPFYDAIVSARASGDRDAWFAAVNAYRAAAVPAMDQLTRSEFDAANPET